MNNKEHRISIKLSTIIVFIIMGAIISGFTAGIIVYTSYTRKTGVSYSNISNDIALKQFLEVYSSVVDDYYTEVNRSEMIDHAIKGMLEYLGDNYTTYLDSDETDNLTNALMGEYRGIGVYINDHEITEVFKDSPAEKAGLKVGDIIKKINDTDVSNLEPDDFIKLIRESKSKNVSITVDRNGDELVLNAEVSKLYVPATEYNLVEGTKIGYLQIATFSSSVQMQVLEALNYFDDENITGLILDLRSNTGGFLSASEAVASFFLEKGEPIYTIKSKNDSITVKDKTTDHTTYPIIVLIDENTASASEILTAALKDNYGATLVGKKSFGKGKVQQTISLLDGTMAKYTSGKWYTPSGKNIDGEGIEPDYEIDLELIKDNSGNVIGFTDTQLNKAVELLSK